MTKSKFSISVFWFMVILSFFSLFMLISIISQYFFSIQIIRFADGVYFHLIAFLLFSLICIPVTVFNATIITIDILDKTITFKNIFSYSNRTYNFNELLGYVESKYRVRGGSELVIYLIKDDKRIERIPEAYYSNFQDLKQGLSTLNYMGSRVFNLYKHLKILFRFKVSD